MKKYNITVKYNGYEFLHSNCFFIENLHDLQEYLVIFNNKFAVSEEEIKTIKSFIGHGHSYLTGVAGMFCGMGLNIGEREPMLAHLKYLQASALTSMVYHVLNGDKLAINHNGGIIPIKHDEEYILEPCSDKTYSKADIKINKWYGGRHYYAKVGGIDVVDQYGSCKWNTEQYAYDMAITFMNKLNQNI